MAIIKKEKKEKKLPRRLDIKKRKGRADHQENAPS